MAKTIVLHIGSGKTGSTSIQNSLNRSKADNDDILSFPLILGQNNQIFRFGFCDLKNTPSNIRSRFKNNPTGFVDYQESIKTSFRNQVSECDNVLVSSEFLFLSKPKEINDIKQYLLDVGFDTFHILAYVREPWSYYLSAAQQSLKTQARLPSPKSNIYDFRTHISNWANFFPNIEIRKFARETLIGGDVIKDFQSFLSDVGYENISLELTKLNRTISAEASQVMQDLQSGKLMGYRIEDYVLRQKIINEFIKIESNKGSKPILKKEIEDLILKHSSESITWLKLQFNIEMNVTTQIQKTDRYKDTTHFKQIVQEFNEQIYDELIESMRNIVLTI